MLYTHIGRNTENVLPQGDESVPVAKPVQVGCCRKRITKEIVESLGIESTGLMERVLQLKI